MNDRWSYVNVNPNLVTVMLSVVAVVVAFSLCFQYFNLNMKQIELIGSTDRFSYVDMDLKWRQSQWRKLNEFAEIQDKLGWSSRQNETRTCTSPSWLNVARAFFPTTKMPVRVCVRQNSTIENWVLRFISKLPAQIVIHLVGVCVSHFYLFLFALSFRLHSLFLLELALVFDHNRTNDTDKCLNIVLSFWIRYGIFRTHTNLTNILFCDDNKNSGLHIEICCGCCCFTFKWALKRSLDCFVWCLLLLFWLFAIK